jgi:hypothetical protein
MLGSTRIAPFALYALALGASCVHAPRSGERASLGGRDVSLRYEGTCAQLSCCSTYSVPLSEPTPGAFFCGGSEHACRVNSGWFAPGFTCDPFVPGRYRQPGDAPFLGCNDNERWLSLPGLSHVECGKRYMVCHRGVRVGAVARDRSASNESGRFHYEASLGLLQAIGADPEARETFVSIYAFDDVESMAEDPQCVGTRP